MPEPCDCEACVVANVQRPPVTIPGYLGTPPKTLHGVELRDYYAAQDELKATLARVKGTAVAKAAAALLGGQE